MEGSPADDRRAGPSGIEDWMRWDGLFADLEAMWEATEEAEGELELPEMIRAERADIGLAARLRHHRGRPLALVAGPHLCRGVVLTVGSEWIVLEESDASGRPTGAQVVVPLAAVVLVHDLPVHAVAEDSVLAKLPLGHVYRALSRDRAIVQVGLTTRDFPGEGTGLISGTIDRVARDHCDLARHDVDEARRPGAVRGQVSVPFGAIAFVRGI